MPNRILEALSRTLGPRRSERSDEEQLAAALRASGLFDAGAYLARHPDVAGRMDPALHYVRHGAGEGRDVCPLFDPAWYRSAYPELEPTGLDPLVHYILRGEAEGRWPNPLFDPVFYREAHPDLVSWPGLLLHHYAQYGGSEGRSSCALFDGGLYLYRYPDAAASGLDPIDHYRMHGDGLGYWPHPLFDPAFYGAQHPELPESGAARLTHYLHHGARDGGDPHPLFSSRFYESQIDHTVGDEPLVAHYIRVGEESDLRPHPLFDPGWYRLKNPNVAGHPRTLLAHYSSFGYREGRAPCPLFDAVRYLVEHPGVALAGQEPLAHYLHEGAAAGASPHPLFDPAWYVSQTPDLGGWEPLSHFLSVGAARGDDPHPLFDSAWVREQAGLAEDEVAIFHYLEEGAALGLAPNRWFAPDWYLTHNAIRLRPGETPLSHFVTAGCWQAMRPGPLFDFGVQFYRQRDPELRGHDVNPMAGYLHEPCALLSCPEAERPIALRAAPAPEVSVVIPHFGPAPPTLACLRSLSQAETEVGFEVIVVDDDPDGGYAHRLSGIPNLQLLRNERNAGFVATCNRGAEAARGRWVVFLNNDALVTDGWLDALVETFSAFPRAGIVGSCLLNPDGSLQEAGGIVWRDASALNFGYGQDPSDLSFRFAREVDYVSAAALMVDTALFRELGGFDAAYTPAFYEDTDLAFRARALGRQVVYQPASRVIHLGGASYGRDVTTGLKRHQEKNRLVFQERFAAALAAHAEPGANPHTESVRLARGHVLVMDATTISPDRDSGSLRMFNLLRILRRMDLLPTFLPADMSSRERYIDDLERIGVRVACPPAIASIERFLEEWGRLFDLCILSRPIVGAKWLDTVQLLCPRAGVLYDMVDLHYLRREREIEVLGTTSVTADEIEAERRACHRADAVIAVSEADREHLAAAEPGIEIHVVSNIHEIHRGVASWQERSELLFIGGFRHAPNRDAVVWFVREVLPRVRERLPDVRLRVVGSEMPEEIEALASDHVLIEGYVADVTPLFERARVAVAPLRYGSGVKGKVNQSMSHGVPCVATSIAAEGMEAEHGSEIWIADSAEAFADAVVRLYEDEALWRRIADGGIASLERTFGMDVAEAHLRDLLQRFGRAER